MLIILFILIISIRFFYIARFIIIIYVKFVKIIFIDWNLYSILLRSFSRIIIWILCRFWIRVFVLIYLSEFHVFRINKFIECNSWWFSFWIWWWILLFIYRFYMVSIWLLLIVININHFEKIGKILIFYFISILFYFLLLPNFLNLFKFRIQRFLLMII